VDFTATVWTESLSDESNTGLLQTTLADKSFAAWAMVNILAEGVEPFLLPALVAFVRHFGGSRLQVTSDARSCWHDFE
jgi:hypothetical protein